MIEELEVNSRNSKEILEIEDIVWEIIQEKNERVNSTM